MSDPYVFGDENSPQNLDGGRRSITRLLYLYCPDGLWLRLKNVDDEHAVQVARDIAGQIRDSPAAHMTEIAVIIQDWANAFEKMLTVKPGKESP